MAKQAGRQHQSQQVEPVSWRRAMSSPGLRRQQAGDWDASNLTTVEDERDEIAGFHHFAAAIPKWRGRAAWLAVDFDLAFGDVDEPIDRNAATAVRQRHGAIVLYCAKGNLDDQGKVVRTRMRLDVISAFAASHRHIRFRLAVPIRYANRLLLARMPIGRQNPFVFDGILANSRGHRVGRVPGHFFRGTIASLVVSGRAMALSVPFSRLTCAVPKAPNILGVAKRTGLNCCG